MNVLDILCLPLCTMRMASALSPSGDPEVLRLVAPDVELSADRGVFDGS